MKFEISQDLLSAAVEAMRELQARYEAEAAALAQISGECPAAHRIAAERAEQADVARGLFIFFADL